MNEFAYRKQGAFSMTAIVFVEKNTPRDHTLSIQDAWLPIGLTPRPELNGADTYRHPDVIPVLGDYNVLHKVAPILDIYAQEYDCLMQPISFHFRPQELVDVIGEETIQSALPSHMIRSISLDDRFYMSIAEANESNKALYPLMQILVSVLESKGIVVPNYVNPNKTRHALVSLLIEFPFLAHHVFEHYPRLRIFRAMAKLGFGRLSRQAVVNYVRYNPDEAHYPDSSFFMRDNSFPISV